MSKAFTRESDDDAREERRPPRRLDLPPGAKNYITSGGARRLRSELAHLSEELRPTLLNKTDATSELSRVDARIQQLRDILESVSELNPAATPDPGRVRFGATVTVRRNHGETIAYRIVGADETDIDRGWVSWLSPIAKALLGATVGSRVRFRFPTGQEELEVLAMTYEEPG